MNELLKKIKSKGYWSVVIRPAHYNKNLIKSLKECKLLITDNKIALRGWDYPHVDIAGIESTSENSIQSHCNWPEGPVYEYWRFYQTGQFIHYFSMREDWRIKDDKIKELQGEYATDSTVFLSILSTLYSITEVYKFASKLFEKVDEVDNIEIIVEIHKVKDRTLMFWDIFLRSLNRAYTCKYENDVVVNKRIVNKMDIVSKFDDYALDSTLKIFEAFGWDTPVRDIFKGDQVKFLERRL